MEFRVLCYVNVYAHDRSLDSGDGRIPRLGKGGPRSVAAVAEIPCRTLPPLRASPPRRYLRILIKEL